MRTHPLGSSSFSPWLWKPPSAGLAPYTPLQLSGVQKPRARQVQSKSQNKGAAEGGREGASKRKGVELAMLGLID